MLPRLQAEESLLATTRVAIGSGTADKDAAQSIRREWDALTGRTRKAIKATPGNMPEGIGVRRVKTRRPSGS